MATITTTTCDNCTKVFPVDAPAIGWMRFVRMPDRIIFLRMEFKPRAENFQTGHLCSSTCAKEQLGLASSEWSVTP
jgi:hypothetical protein